MTSTVPNQATNSNMEQTIGQKRMRVSFNPSTLDKVHDTKMAYALLIDQAEELKANAEDGEVKRLCAIAATELETAGMYIVKALTAGK